MKLAGIVKGTNPVKGAFSQSDGEAILLDFTQGAHGRAFCGVRTYDLPDPKAQLVTVSNPSGTVEISGPHGVAAQMGNVSVRTLKANGDVNLPILRVERLDLNHSSISANEVTGPTNDTDPEIEPDRIRDIRMRDSNLHCRGDLVFQNIECDERTPSSIRAAYLEGATTQGKLTLQAGSLMIYLLEAHEVQVTKPDGCRIGNIHCNRVLQRTGIGETRPIAAIKDPDLVMALQALSCPAGGEGLNEIEPVLDAQGFEM
jgi:hypothetical protein